MNQVSKCPRCGAPIYAVDVPSDTAGDHLPETRFTCECRLSLAPMPIYVDQPWWTRPPMWRYATTDGTPPWHGTINVTSGELSSSTPHFQ